MVLLAEKLAAAVQRGDAPAVNTAWDDHWAGDAATKAKDSEIARLPLELMHDLLLMPGHYIHQPIALAIQKRGNPASLPIVKQVLDRGFGVFAYTCSDDAAIAKWFSHILGNIGAPEAVNMLQHYAKSENTAIANEMQYRLSQIGRQTYQ
jgi:hypothetical protein